MDDGGGLYIIWTQLRAYAVPIFVYLAGFTGCTGSLARLKHGKCGGNDPLWMDGSWFGSRRFSSLFVSSFIFPFGCVPHGQNMQSQILHHLASLSLGFFSQNSSGKLRKIINENTAQTENFLAHQLPDMTGSAVTAVTMLVMLLFFDWRLGGLSILLLVAGFMVQMLMTNEKSMSYMRKYQDASEQMNNEAVEYVRGIPVVKVFQQTIYSFKSFYAAIMYYKDNVTEYALSCQGPMVAFNVIINASFAVLIPAGILLISPEQYSEFLLDLIFYILFTSGSAGILNKILFSGTYRMMAQEAVRRVDSLLAETPVVEHEPSRIPNQNDVEFRDVTFTYPGGKAPALSHLSFQVPEGKTVALVGASGSGKTTAATLIPRFWDVQEGAVCIGGVPVSQIPKQELMNRIAFVFQDSRLLKASILENVRASRPDATREQVLEALQAAQCDDIWKTAKRRGHSAGDQGCLSLRRRTTAHRSCAGDSKECPHCSSG